MDVADWEEAYVKYADDLVRFAATLVGSDDAEDLVATTFLNVLRSDSTNVTQRRAYLYRSVVNTAQKHHRTERRRERREALTAVSGAHEGDETEPGVHRALLGLSRQQRAVVHLTYWEDLAPSAVGERLGVSEGTVRKQLARARRALRESLE
jgi:RNA polymerase sigma-70 factor (ECF subfamily)